MNTIGANQRPGDIVECFPLHNCVVAQSFYDKRITLKGGVIHWDDYKKVHMPNSGVSWEGYRNGDATNDRFKPFVGRDLGDRIGEDIADTDHIWLIAGNGTQGYYPPGGVVEGGLGHDWALVDEWDFTPLSLKYYKRENG